MPQDLASLITQYRWLRSELGAPATVQQRLHEVEISDALDALFLEIVRFKACDPRISYRQIEFLLEIMAEARTDREARALLGKEVLVHVKRLADRVRSRDEQSAH